MAKQKPSTSPDLGGVPLESVTDPQPLKPGSKSQEQALANLRERSASRQESDPIEEAPTMILNKAQVIEVTLQELEAACEANPDHSVAQVYALACSRMKKAGAKPTFLMSIDNTDLQALLGNQEVVQVVFIDEDGNRVLEKQLLSRSAAKSAASTPAQPQEVRAVGPTAS